MRTSDYCKHGVYVGGCGIDWMCQACEMGDPDPTVNDLAGDLLRLLERASDFRAAILDEQLNPNLRAFQSIWQGFHGDIDRILRQLAEVREWAEHDDDDNWMRRRHAFYSAQDVDDEPATYSEIDEIHEYGYVPT